MTPRGSRREAGPGRCRGCGLRHPAATRSRDRSSQHAPVLVARWPAVRTCGLEPSRTGPSSFGFCGPARRSRTVRRRPQCGAHRLRQAHVPPQRRSHPPPAHRSGEELPQLQNPQAQPGRRRLRGDADDPPGGLVAITDNADPMDAVVYRTATRLRHHQHRVVCQVPVFAKSASASENSLIGSGRSLSVENNYGYQDPFGPHIGAITRLRLRAGRHQQARQRLRAGVDKPHREPPQRGYQDSPRQPRQDRALRASASGANQPRAHGSTSPQPAYLLRRSAAISHGRVRQLLPVIAATRSVLGAHQICGRNSARHLPARAQTTTVTRTHSAPTQVRSHGSGFARVDINKHVNGCGLVWTNHTGSPQRGSKALHDNLTRTARSGLPHLARTSHAPMARRRRHRAYLLRRSAAISHGRVRQLLPVIAATRSVLGAHQICGRNSARHVPARARMRVSPNAQVASRNSPQAQRCARRARPPVCVARYVAVIAAQRNRGPRHRKERATSRDALRGVRSRSLLKSTARLEPRLPAETGLVGLAVAAGRGRMKMGDDVGVARDADHFLVLVSPRLVWRVGLPGAPDCCHEHACQTR